jgi:hypothetical protein
MVRDLIIKNDIAACGNRLYHIKAEKTDMTKELDVC